MESIFNVALGVASLVSCLGLLVYLGLGGKPLRWMVGWLAIACICSDLYFLLYGPR